MSEFMSQRYSDKLPSSGWARRFRHVAVLGLILTTWSRLRSGAAPGTYGLQARATDAAGNLIAKPYATFTVQ